MSTDEPYTQFHPDVITPHEFEGIALQSKPYPLMSKPTPLVATNLFVREVQDALTGKTAQEQADWVLNKMERYAAAFSEPVFDMEGNGPQCSLCSAPWTLCGHHHMSVKNISDKDTP